MIDPISVHEAEALIEAINQGSGEAQGNYDESGFFTGLRPSEQIALLVSACDLNQAKIKVMRARVIARDNDRTKTSKDRLIELGPRALEILSWRCERSSSWPAKFPTTYCSSTGTANRGTTCRRHGNAGDEHLGVELPVPRTV